MSEGLDNKEAYLYGTLFALIQEQLASILRLGMRMTAERTMPTFAAGAPNPDPFSEAKVRDCVAQAENYA